MAMKQFTINRKFPKAEVTREQVEQERVRQEKVGGECTLIDEGDAWHLVCNFFGGERAG